MKNLLVIILLVMPFAEINAAFIQFLPYTITQPNGTIIHCFTSGDEFNSWLHNEDGYTIIQDSNGYFTYAIPVEKQITNNANETQNLYQILNLKPSKFIVGIDEIPNNIPKWLIPQREIEHILRQKHNDITFESDNNENKNKGKFCNLVIFIKFDGDEDFQTPLSFYDSIFNATDAPSLKDYYSNVSYNQIEIQNYILKTKDNGIFTYTDNQKRDFYRPVSQTNPIGYATDSARRARRDALLFNATKHIEKFLPDTVELDCNNDSSVDNITFIFQGNSDNWGSIFWAQAGSVGRFYTLKGKTVNKCVIIPNNQLFLGILAHEFFHNFGAPDLYRYNNPTNFRSVHSWDIMESAYQTPQSMCAYMKYQYGKWIPQIPTISLPGKYKLNPLTQKDSNAFIINSTNPMEYYVLEYRKPIGRYESSLAKIIQQQNVPFDGGLLVYRINKSLEGRGNSGANATTSDEVYCYRPDGTNTENGRPQDAAFNSKYLRPAFNHQTNPTPFLFNGSDGGLSISNIYEQDTILHFTVHFRDITFIKYPNSSTTVGGILRGVSLRPMIIWDLLRGNRHYNLQLSLEHNFPENNRIEASIQNDSIFYLKEDLLPNKDYYVRVGAVETNGSVRFWSRVVIFRTANVVSFDKIYNEICAGKVYDFPFDVIADIPENTEFRLVLSNKNGQFGSGEVVMGSIRTNRRDTISVEIPKNIVTGYNYSIKLVAANNPDALTVMPNVKIFNIPEVEILFKDTVACRDSISEISFKPLLHNVVDAYYKFDWKCENCEIIQTNDENFSAKIRWNRVGLAEVRVIATNITGCSDIYSKRLKVNDIPQIIFSGAKNVCPNQPIRYYFPEQSTMPTTVEVENGTYRRINRDTIEIIWENRSSGLVNITRTIDSSGYCPNTISFTVAIDSIPIPAIIGEMSFCCSDTSRYFSSVLDTVNYYIHWKIDGSGRIIGANTRTSCVVVSDLDADEDAEINLSLTISRRSSVCFMASDTTILIFKSPAIPVISVLDSFLVCSLEGVEYRWYCDDIEIENSDMKQIIPLISGLYSVEIWDVNGCSSLSDFYEFDATSIDFSDILDYFIELTANHIFIYFADDIERVNFELIDILGRVIYRGDNHSKSIISIDRTRIPNGLYHIKFSRSSSTFFHKLLLQP